MACSVIRDAKTGEILQVMAPNGKESKLFKDILPLVDNNKAEALRLWAQVYTPTFKSWFGNWEDAKRLEDLTIEYPDEVKFYRNKPSVFLDTIPKWYDRKNNNAGIIAIAKSIGVSYKDFESRANELNVHYKQFKNYLKSEGVDDSIKIFEENGEKYFINKKGEKKKLNQYYGDEVFLSEDFKESVQENVANKEKNFKLLNTYQPWVDSLIDLQNRIKNKFNSSSKVVDENGEPLLINEMFINFEGGKKSLFNKGGFSSYSDNIYEQREISNLSTPLSSLETLLKKLSTRFNIQYKIVDEPNSKWVGRYVSDGTVLINRAKANAQTAFHEFLHPFLLTLREENPVLYNELIKELQNSIDGLKVLADVKKLYPDLRASEQLEEALVTYLGQVAEAKYTMPKSLLERFLKWLRNLFKKVNTIDFANLSLNTKLGDIADMVVDDLFVADLIGVSKRGDVVKIYEQRDTDLTYQNIFNRIKERLAILSATLSRRKKGEQFKDDIEALKAIFESQDEITSINNFVANSLQYVDSAYKRFEELRNNVKNFKTLSPEEISYNLYILGELQQLLNVYESLHDIQLLMFREGLKSTDDVMAKLSDALAKHKIMANDFKPFALTYLTEWLFPYLEPTNESLRKEGYEQNVITKEQFREQLSVALRDISAAGMWLGATINSQDPVSAAIGLALKDVVYENHLENVKNRNQLTEEYKKVKGTSLFTSKKDINEFNMQFLKEVENYEQVGTDDEGHPTYDFVRRLAFHTEYNDDQFNKERIQFFNRIGKKPARNTVAYRNWQKQVTQWYVSNTRLDPDAAGIIEQKRRTLTKRQFERWLLENTKEVDEEMFSSGLTKSEYFKARGLLYSTNPRRNTFRIYSGVLIKPAEKYRNREFRTMMQNPYYRNLYLTYQRANEKLGLFGLKYGIIPQVPNGGKPLIDKSLGFKDNAINVLKSPVRAVKADPESTRTIERQDGTEVKSIPIFYTTLLPSTNISIDLINSVIKFSEMSNNYDKMLEIEPNILILKTVLNGDFKLGIEGRKIAKTNAKGKNVINAITKKLVPKLVKDDMLNKRLNEFIDDIVYGDKEFQDSINLLGRDISVNKIADKVGFFTSLSTMALNVTGGISNVIIGNYNNMIEAFGGRFWGKRDWTWAQKTYWANIGESMNELATGEQGVMGFVAEHYDVPQGEFMDQWGNKVSAGIANRLFKTDNLFFIQNGGEHEIQITGLLSLMHATKVKTKDGREVTLFEAWKMGEVDGRKIPPYENPDLIWTIEDDKAFRNRIQAITKSLQGIYNQFDKAALSRRWYGKLALKFRKYMFSSFKARYGARYVDYELGTVQEGYWRVFAKKLLKDAKDYKWGMFQRMWSKEGYDSVEAAAVNKTLFELCVILAISVLAAMIDDDDDDKSWIENELALQLTRMSADIKQFINPADFLRIIRNPAASVNLMERWVGWFQQLLNPFEEYERASGIAKKGDNKLYIKTLKLLPITRQVINLLTPEEQIKFYQMTNR